MQDLEAGYEHLGGTLLPQRLLGNLNKGERVVFIAIGSSFIATNSGCWQVSLIAYDFFDVGQCGILQSLSVFTEKGLDQSSWNHPCIMICAHADFNGRSAGSRCGPESHCISAVRRVADSYVRFWINY